MELRFLNSIRKRHTRTTIFYIVDRYFYAWKMHSINVLEKTFAPHATYTISNKKIIYVGFDEIKEYWLRNKDRQRSLKISYKILVIKDNYCELAFKATFTDIEEHEKQSVQGRMKLRFQKNKILGLEENYVKNVLQEGTSIKSATNLPVD